MSDDDFENIGILLIIILVIAVYFVPSIIAAMRNHSQKMAIFLLNLFTGGTGIGWVASIIWAFIDRPIFKIEEKTPTVAQELKELAQLKEEGIITEEEFEIKKNNLLNF